MPQPGDGEVVVSVEAVGVCGSDVHYYEHGRIGSFVADGPLILGHESAGTVASAGRRTSRRPGDRVAVEPGLSCGECRQCRSGAYNLCPDMRFFGTPPVDGAFARYVVVHERQTVLLPDSVSVEAGALAEPLSVAIWACRRGGVRIGSSVIVTGAGPIGLCTSMVALAGGARVTVVDPVATRRQMASDLGAVVVDPDDIGEPRFDVFIECSGSREAFKAGLSLLRPRGTGVIVGMGADAVDVNVPLLQQREITLTGTFRYAHTYEDAVALMASRRVDPTRLIGARFSLEEVESALRCTSEDPSVVKAMVLPAWGC